MPQMQKFQSTIRLLYKYTKKLLNSQKQLFFPAHTEALKHIIQREYQLSAQIKRKEIFNMSEYKYGKGNDSHKHKAEENCCCEGAVNDNVCKPHDCKKECTDAVCIHTDKVIDSCRDKDCLEDVRVYFTASGQEIIDCAINVKCTKAEIIWVFSEVNRSKYNFLCKKEASRLPVWGVPTYIYTSSSANR